MKNFSVTWFLMHFNGAWTNFLGCGCHHSIQVFQARIHACFDRSESAVPKLRGTSCAAPIVCSCTVKPACTTCVLLTVCTQGSLQHALHMWGSTEGCLRFAGYMHGMCRLTYSSTLQLQWICYAHWAGCLMTSALPWWSGPEHQEVGKTSGHLEK